MSKLLYVTYVSDMSDELYDEICDNTVFADSEGNIITIVHDSDGDWRGEYFNPILKYFDIIVEKPNQDMINIIENNLKLKLGVKL